MATQGASGSPLIAVGTMGPQASEHAVNASGSFRGLVRDWHFVGDGRHLRREDHER